MTKRGSNALTGAATRIKPFAQGDLDNLCGPYAIINAIRLAMHGPAPLSSSQVERLFRTAIDWLDKNASVTSAVSHGLSQKHWRGLARHLIAKTPHAARGVLDLIPLPVALRLAPEAACEWIGTQLAQQRPVLVLLHERYYHYTVISGISDSRIALFDSYGYHWLTRRSCSFRRQPHPSRHRLAATSILALRWTEL